LPAATYANTVVSIAPEYSTIDGFYFSEKSAPISRIVGANRGCATVQDQYARNLYGFRVADGASDHKAVSPVADPSGPGKPCHEATT
jgi:hypothetical protein